MQEDRNVRVGLEDGDTETIASGGGEKAGIRKVWFRA
jgi:hypothetical protein